MSWLSDKGAADADAVAVAVAVADEVGGVVVLEVGVLAVVEPVS